MLDESNEKTVNKSEFINWFANEVNTPGLEAEVIFDAIIESIIVALQMERRIEIRGFGVFHVKKRNVSSGRNPRTGQAIEISENKMTATFKAGKKLRERVANVKCPPKS